MSDAPTTWRPDDMPSLAGLTAVVTGPTVGGLGFHTAYELARNSARVILVGRNPAKVAEAAREIHASQPGADLGMVEADLSRLDSVRRAADDLLTESRIDLLVNNAGVMAPQPAQTVDGLDLQMATNHFGPFLLTGLLFPKLSEAPAGRVVTVSSQMHRIARSAPLSDPRRTHGTVWRWTGYGQAKLANLLFTYELQRRLDAGGHRVRALAAHPGFAGTHLAVNSQVPQSSRRRASILDATIRAVSQSAAQGAWPTLMAATADLPGGSYVGPRGVAEFSGEPTLVTPHAMALDEVSQRRLWEISEEAVGLVWP